MTEFSEMFFFREYAGGYPCYCVSGRLSKDLEKLGSGVLKTKREMLDRKSIACGSYNKRNYTLKIKTIKYSFKSSYIYRYIIPNDISYE